MILLTVATNGAAPADEPPDLPQEELARRGTDAAALVDLRADSRLFATAFCVHPSGLFVTTAEPLFSSPTQLRDSVRLVIRPGRPDQTVHDARVLQRLKEPGLALLQIDGAQGLYAPPWGTPDAIEELMEVAAFDVPSLQGSEPSSTNQYPRVRVGRGSVSATQRQGGQLHRIQFDAPLSTGSTGGLLLDAKGRVLGVILGRARANFGAGVDLAVPVNLLEGFLNHVDLKFDPPVVNEANLCQPVEFEALTTALFPAKDPLNVELILGGGEWGAERRFPMTLTDGSYRVKAEPAAARFRSFVELEAVFDDGTFHGRAEDRMLEIAGAQAVRLGEVRRLRLGTRSVALLGNGATLVGGTVSGLDNATTVTVGGQVLGIDLGRAQMITVKPPGEYPAIPCTVVARRAGREVGRISTPIYQQDRVWSSMEQVRKGRFLRPARSNIPVTYVSFGRRKVETYDNEGVLVGPAEEFDPKEYATVRGNDVKVSLLSSGRYLSVDAVKGVARGVRRTNATRGVTVASALPGKPDRREITFEAPHNQNVTAGDYPDARGMDVSGNAPELKWSPDGCNDGDGHFVVWEIEVKDNQVSRLAIDFVGRCKGLSSTSIADRSKGGQFVTQRRFYPVYGMIRFRSTFQ